MGQLMRHILFLLAAVLFASLEANAASLMPGWSGGPTPLYVRDPTATVTYDCVRRIWITPTGTSSGPGTTNANGFDTFPHLQANVSPPLGSAGGGDCVSYLSGHTYNDSIQLHAASTGTANNPTGWIAFESVDSTGAIVDAAVHTVLNSSAAKIVNTLDDGTPIFGTDSATTAPNFIIIRGFELTDKAGATSFESCVNTNGPGTWSNPNQFGPSHWAMFNNYAHDCNGGAFVTTNGDFIWIQNNVILNTSCCSAFSASAISIATPKHTRALPLSGFDAAMVYKNIVVGNYCSNAIEYAINRNAGIRTDGECVILDDFAGAQSAGTGSGNTNAGLYQFPTIVANNVGFNNGGNGIQINTAFYVTTANNTMYCNNADQAIIAADRPEILIGDGDWNLTYNNIAYACGPWTYVTQSLASPGATLHVNDVRPVSEFILNHGNFTYTVVSLGASNEIPVYINGTKYLAVSYAADVTNTCNPTVTPGCVSGTITLTTNVTVADGAQFNSVNVQVINNGIDCTGQTGGGQYCQFTGFVFPLQSVPFRANGFPQTCSGVPPGCPLITLIGNNPNSIIGANMVKTINGGGGFEGLNAATPLSDTNFGDKSTVLGTNVQADPVLNNISYVTTDVAAGGGDAQGPGWLATITGTTPPPNLAPLASISPVVGAASIVPATTGGAGGARPAFCPSIDILGNATNCLTTPFNIGAYNTQGAPLNYTGVGNVPNVPTPLLFYGTVAYSKAGASNRLPALQVNCNTDPTTSYVININTSGVLDDAGVELVCSGYEAGTNIVHVSRAFEQVLGNRECDLLQATAANQPTLLFNNVSNKSVLKFSGSQWLQLAIVPTDQFCGQMFATPSIITVSERTFGTGGIVVGNDGSGSANLGYSGAFGSNLAFWQQGGTTLTPAQTDSTYSALMASGYFSVNCCGFPPAPPTEAGQIGVNTVYTSGTFSPNLWDTALAWGAQPGGTNAFTGFSPVMMVYALPFTQSAEQIVPIGVTQAQFQSIYTNALKPAFGLP